MTVLEIPNTATTAQKLPPLVAGLYLCQHKLEDEIQAKIIPHDISPSRITLSINRGTTLTGLDILKFFGTLDDDYSGDEHRLEQIQHWIAKSPVFEATTYEVLEKPLAGLDQLLARQSYIVKSNLGIPSVADVILWATIRANPLARMGLEGSRYSHVARWNRRVVESMPYLGELVAEFSNVEDGEWEGTGW